METLSSIALIGLCISAILFTIGIIRPGFTVFWNKSNSRKNVFIVWGSLLMVFAILFFVASSQRHDSRKETDAGNQEIETHSQDQ
jgi:hypothetical protein